MNLKQNAWMYLFFASVLLWVGTVTFSCEAAPKVEAPTVETSTPETDKKPPCDSLNVDYRLTRDTATNRINRYLAYIKESLPKPPAKPKAGDLNNPDVRYFHLPRCELDEMLKEVGSGGDVRAHLAIKTDSITKQQEIILVFSDHLDTPTKWYDFINPCPTVCAQ